MTNKLLLGGSALMIGGAVALMTFTPAAAQGVIQGERQGAERGDRDAGPVGAIVGGAVGAVTGGVNGLLGNDERPRFHDYVREEHRPSYRYSHDIVVGTVLPSDGVQYYEVPREYGATPYRYTVVNDRTVLVDPRTHRVVEVID
jgi:hypothetical protein